MEAKNKGTTEKETHSRIHLMPRPARIISAPEALFHSLLYLRARAAVVAKLLLEKELSPMHESAAENSRRRKQ
jgi:hypothetical protein